MGYRMAQNLRKKMPATSALVIYDAAPSTCLHFKGQCENGGPIEISTSNKDVASRCSTILTIILTSDNVGQMTNPTA